MLASEWMKIHGRKWVPMPDNVAAAPLGIVAAESPVLPATPDSPPGLHSPEAILAAYESPLLEICRGGCEQFGGGVHCREIARLTGCGAGSIAAWIAAGRDCPFDRWRPD